MHTPNSKLQRQFLAFTTLIVGLCSIIYELLICTTSSYFLGNSIQQFSLIIGIYMASMGLGSWLSRWIMKDTLFYFTIVEIILGIVGAFSVPLCYYYFLHVDFASFNLITFLIVCIIGTLTGLEVPLLTRIMEDHQSLKNNISNVLTFDYLGALIATLIFPFFLVPFVGLYRSSLIFGLINIVIGVLTFLVYTPSFSRKQKRVTLTAAALGIIMVLVAIVGVNKVLEDWNGQIFKQELIYQKDSNYQNISVTKGTGEFRLYLNGAIQFSSRDEYRYHESLVHIPLHQIDSVKRVLLLGGGDGLAAREILKYAELESLTIVDIDPEVSRISTEIDLISDLNGGSLSDPRVQVVNKDAFVYLMQNEDLYDAILCDLPDPTTEGLARLYSNAFFKLIKRNLKPDGVVVTQATSPELTTTAFWCIDKTLKTAGFNATLPYQVSVPSFGMWGFVMAKASPIFRDQYRADISRKFIEDNILEHLSYFPSDKRQHDVLSNNLDQPILLDYYLDHWHSLQGKER